MKNLIFLLLFISMTFLTGCAQVNYDMPEQSNEQDMKTYSFPGQLPDEQIYNKIAVIKTAKGEIRMDLYAEAAPFTVSNFVYLANQGFYNGLTFHRVEPGFVVQGGDPSADGTGGPGYTVPAEISPDLKHIKGAVAMARLPDQINPKRASSGSQFYIALDELSSLDGAYTVFGQVIQGMDVVERIQVGDVIESIEILDKE